MPFHQLVIELPGRELARAEEACRRLGAMASPSRTRRRAAARAGARRDAAVAGGAAAGIVRPGRKDPALLAATLAAVLGLAPESVAVEHVEDRAWEREWLKDFRPMRLRPAPLGLPRGPAARGAGRGRARTRPRARLRHRHACDHGTLPRMAGRRRSGAASACSTTAAVPGSWPSPRSSSARPRDSPSTSIRRRCTRRARMPRRTGSAERIDDRRTRRATSPAASTSCSPTSCPARWSSSRRPRAAGRAGGAVVLAGMLSAQADEVAQAYRPWFDIGPVAEREGWILLAGRRRAE